MPFLATWKQIVELPGLCMAGVAETRYIAWVSQVQATGDKERTAQHQAAQLGSRVDILERELAAARQERSDAGTAAGRQLAELQARLREAEAARQAEQLALREELARAKVPRNHGDPSTLHAACSANQLDTQAWWLPQ
jgi:hypothetical protein